MAERKLRLLSLDGGGVRGLSSLYILQQLLQKINPENPPLPYKFFDMIGGTSTGGIIAIMLGVLKMSIGDCIEEYLTIMDVIFSERGRPPLDWRGHVRGRFSTEVFEGCIKDVLRRYNVSVDAKMRTPGQDPECKTFVCAISRKGIQQVQFGNFRRDGEFNPGGLLDGVTILQAARATSAASSYFEPIAIGRNEQKFLDAGTGQNNPVNRVWLEAMRYWAESNSHILETRLDCFISIGTGVPEFRDFGAGWKQVMQSLVNIATDTEHTADQFSGSHEDLLESCRYMRLNVERGLGSVGLEEARKRADIEAATAVYCGSNDMRLKLNRFRANYFTSQTALSHPSSLPSYDEVTTTLSIERVPQANRATEREPAQLQNMASAWASLGSSVDHLRRQTNGSYWNHVTVKSLAIYERIYEEARDPDRPSEGVSFSSYKAQFPAFGRPGEKEIEDAWTRLASTDQLLKKSFIMALTYMIHLENELGHQRNAQLKHIPGELPFDGNRLIHLRNFSRWVWCTCGCKKQWSLANEVEGLQKGGDPTISCKAYEWRHLETIEERLADKYADGRAAYEAIAIEWLGHEQRPIEEKAPKQRISNFKRFFCGL